MHGHTIDLIFKNDSQLISSVSVTEGVSDHNGIIIELSVRRQRPNLILKTFHQFRKLDKVVFQKDIINSELCTNPSTDADILAN